MAENEQSVPERFESAVRLAPVIFFGEPNLVDVTGCPNATQPESVTVSMFFIRPRMGNWQVACGLCLNLSKFRPAGTTFAAI